MKKYICTIISILLMCSFSSCFVTSNRNRVTVDETEEHFYNYVQDIKQCMELCNIENECKYFDYSFEENTGTINININTDTFNAVLLIEIYNDISNPLGDDYELGLEKYYIYCQNTFNSLDNAIDTENPVYEIIAVVLSDVTSETLIVDELKSFLSSVKDNLDISQFKDIQYENPFFEYSDKFKDIYFRYSLIDTAVPNSRYNEVIKFGGEGYNNYTNVE